MIMLGVNLHKMRLYSIFLISSERVANSESHHIRVYSKHFLRTHACITGKLRYMKLVQVIHGFDFSCHISQPILLKDLNKLFQNLCIYLQLTVYETGVDYMYTYTYTYLNFHAIFQLITLKKNRKNFLRTLVLIYGT